MNFLRKSNTSLSSLSSLLRSKKTQSRPFPYNNNHHQNTHKIRSFYTNRSSQNLQHFKRHRGGAHWYRNPRVVLAVTVVSGASAISIYYGNLETVPYTKRTHFVLLSPSFERQLGEGQFQELKKQLKPKILPSIHPDSVRVRLISKEIIAAVERGLRHSGGDERRWGEIEYTVEGLEDTGYGWGKEDEVLDDRWVRESRREKGGAQGETKHLEGLEWEVLVVRDGMVNAFCLPGGKIVVFTGLLDHFRSDAEIATVIGHEVGHAIARHAAEGITRNFWFALLQLIILQFFYMPDLINMMSNLLLRLPFSRRMEMEADYIGLLLLASAGYDPRVAPNVYEKLGQITGDSALRDYLSTHPSSKKRAQLLSKAEVMNEALAIYRERIAGRGVAGFL